MKTRMEHDSMGEIAVEEDKYWGAQTQRSYENFKIGDEKIPLSMICAFAHLKLACARSTMSLAVWRSVSWMRLPLPVMRFYAADWMPTSHFLSGRQEAEHRAI